MMDWVGMVGMKMICEQEISEVQGGSFEVYNWIFNSPLRLIKRFRFAEVV